MLFPPPISSYDPVGTDDSNRGLQEVPTIFALQCVSTTDLPDEVGDLSQDGLGVAITDSCYVML